MTIINPKRSLAVPRHARKKMNKVAMIVFRSIDGEKDWTPVPPDEVPAFVKRSDIVKRMLDGEMVQLESVGPHWYRSEQVSIH